MAQPRSQELKIVGLMALGFGLVGIDRFLISPLFPTIAMELHLNYSDIGTIAGALALAWGIAALLMGNISDRIGRRKVVTGALLLFSLLIGASGLAAGLWGLVVVRIIMGIADGAYTPPSISATLDASPPKRHGLNIGIQQMMLPLCGLALAPWLVGQLLPHVGWRWIFVLFSVPGLILTAAVWKFLPAASTLDREQDSFALWKAVLGYHNIRLLMPLMLCWLTCLITTSALMPSYLIDFHHLTQGQMGGIMAAIGLGSTIGTLALPAFSDVVGRKPVMIGSAAGAAASLWMLAHTGSDPVILFIWLGAVHLFNNACITLTVGPICAETVPSSLMATATGVVIACGELGGGGLAPIIAGQVADRFGIEHILWLPLGAIGVALAITPFLKETRWSAEHGK